MATLTMLQFFILKASIFFFEIGLRNQIFVENKNLVYFSLKRYKDMYEYDDLCQNSVPYFLRAIQRFDSSRAAFSSFMVPSLKGSASHYFRDNNDMIRCPRGTNAYIIVPFDIKDSSEYLHCGLRLNYQSGSGSEIIDKGNDNTYKYLDLYHAIEALPEKQQSIVRLHSEGYSNREISTQIGLNVASVSRNLHKAFSTLRQRLA